MRDKVKGLLIGITIGSMLTGVTAYAASGTPIKALLQKVNIYVDGTKKLTANAITYNNTTYVPVRSISTALGENVALKSNNLYIGKQPLTKLTGNQAFELLYKKIKKEIEMYSLTVDEEPKDGNYYVMRSYSDRETYEVTYGLYYIHMYTGEVYEWNFKSKKMVKL